MEAKTTKATAESCQIEGRGSELTEEALLMSVTDHVWNALTFIGQLEGKMKSQAEAARSQQVKIESLTEHQIRLETQPDLVLRPAMAEHIQEWDSFLEFCPNRTHRE